MKRYCPSCKKERDTVVVLRRETYPVMGKWVNLMTQVRVCTVCGENIFDETLDEATLERVRQIGGNTYKWE